MSARKLAWLARRTAVWTRWRDEGGGGGMDARRLTRLALLTAAALALFVVELQLPDLFPIPGAKLGLANIVTVYALYRCRAGEAAMVLAARILLGGLLGGRGIAILYSAAGGAACFAGMLLLKRLIPERHLWLASVFGAALHNLGQMAVASIIAGTAVLAYLPFLLLAGCAAGAFTGLCAQLVIQKGRFGKL